MIKKKQFVVNVALATLLACPMSMMAGIPCNGPADNNDDDDDDEITIVVHGPHRLPLDQPLVSAKFDAGNGIVEITFGEALTNVNVKIFKNGMMMDWYIGNAVAGTKYMTPVGNDGSNTGIVLYIVSSGKVCSVISID